MKRESDVDHKCGGREMVRELEGSGKTPDDRHASHRLSPFWIDVTKKSSASSNIGIVGSVHTHNHSCLEVFLSLLLANLARWSATKLLEVSPRRYHPLQRRQRPPQPTPRNLRSYSHASHLPCSRSLYLRLLFKALRVSISGFMIPLPLGCAASTRSLQRLL